MFGNVCASKGYFPVWDTVNDHFSLCFRDVLTPILPLLTVLIWGALASLFFCYQKADASPRAYCRLSSWRQGFTVATALLPCFGRIAVSVLSNSPQVAMEHVLFGDLMFSLAPAAAIYIQHKEVIKGRSEIPMARVFWSIYLLSLSPRIYSCIVDFHIISDIPILLTAMAALLTAVSFLCFTAAGEETTPGSTQLPLLSAATGQQERRLLAPELTASFWSLVTFSWMSDLLQLGNSRTLGQSDLYNLPNSESSSFVSELFAAAWKDELKRPKGEASLARAIWRISSRTLFHSSFFKLTYDILVFVGPLILSRLINFLNSYIHPDASHIPISVKTGLLYVAILLITSLIQSMTLHQYFHRQFRTGIMLKAAIGTAIFEKCLKLREGESGKDNTDGAVAVKAGNSSSEVLSFMSVDCQKIQELMTYIQILWSAPLQISLALVMLWNQIGVGALAGFLILLVLIPITAVVTRLSHKKQSILMSKRSDRLSCLNEWLLAVRIVKMHNWESSFLCRILKARETELETLWVYKLWQTVSRIQWLSTPSIVSLCSLGFYVALGNKLTAAKAFTSMALFSILKFPMQVLPGIITNSIEAHVSLRRVQDYLSADEIPYRPYVHAAAIEGKNIYLVKSENAKFEWPNGNLLLKGVSFALKPAQLTVVLGRTGCGKSGLMQGLIGDIIPTEGTLAVGGNVSYCPQTPWIKNETVRDNILSGKPYNPAWYNRVMNACCLLQDMEILAAGDMTEIGERGINLSGGQKQRVSLARAVYSKADAYFFDDVMSAVDSNVAAQLISECFLGLLKNKCLLIVSHRLEILPHADQVLFIGDDQRLTFVGHYNQLKGIPEFIKFSAEIQTQDQVVQNSPTEAVEIYRQRFSGDLTPLTDQNENATIFDDLLQTPGGMDGSAEIECGFMDTPRSASVAHLSPHSSKACSTASFFLRRSVIETHLKHENERENKIKDGGVLMDAEQLSVGAVSRDVYKNYIKAAGGYPILALSIFLIALTWGVMSISNAWLSWWTDLNLSGNMGIAVLAGMTLVNVITVSFSSLNFAAACQRTSQKFHEELVHRIFSAPLIFFDTTPVGRIVNRFARDINVVDEVLAITMVQYLNTFFSVATTMVIIAWVFPFFLLVFLPLFGFYKFVERYFVATSRQLQRMDSAFRSPILQHLAETVAGVASIRATRGQASAIHENYRRLDQQLGCNYLIVSANRWLAMRLELCGTLTVVSTALIAVASRGRVTAGMGGLAVAYALQITQSLNWLVRCENDKEANLVSVERLVEYIETCPQEAPRVILDSRPPVGWPSEGGIDIDDLKFGYRSDLPLVLDGLTVHIKPCEKIGVVGRTGAGKSTVFLAILRLVEKSGGSIKIDGVEVSSIGLDDLRSKLSVIPQEPVLFNGTMRFNIDPVEAYSDEEIWTAITRAHLIDFVEQLDGQLDFVVDEGGRNVSMGQRQLVCLARALLRQSPILLLDEATSAVDPQTESLIQDTINEEFSHCTILTIAHRINTVIDYDKILVLQDGRVAEFDEPQELIKNPDGIFRSMCMDAGITGDYSANVKN